MDQRQFNLPPSAVKDAKDQVCQCGGELFMPVFRLKKVDKLAAGLPKDVILPVQKFACLDCGQELQYEDSKPKIET